MKTGGTGRHPSLRCIQLETAGGVMREFSDVLARKREGSLKIYLGYAAGVGKTCAMLREAHNLLEQGFDVVAAYVEPHDRPDTRTLLDGIETSARAERRFPKWMWKP